MIARKCDRCGAFYDSPKEGELAGFQWVCGPSWSRLKLIDLCPDCTDKLNDWMEGNSAERTEPVESSRGLEEVRREADEVHETEDPDREEAESSDVPTKMRQYSIEEQVKMRLSGMMPKEIAKLTGAKARSISTNISLFKKENPDRYAELAKEAEGNSCAP